MLRAMHLIVTETQSAFEPEGGAYGSGARHGHGHEHHDHAHSHGHGHVTTLTDTPNWGPGQGAMPWPALPPRRQANWHRLGPARPAPAQHDGGEHHHGLTRARTRHAPRDPAALLQLMWLASPALPVGGFSYSEGLESAVDSRPRDHRGQAATWLVDQLHLSLRAPTWPWSRRP